LKRRRRSRTPENFKRRDVNAAKCFLRRALREHGDPLSITLDAYAASHRAVAQLREEGEIHYEKMRVRSCQYLNNIVEQDHRRIKQRVYPMLGLKIFENARVVISGIELAQRIRKGQFDLRQLGGARASDAEQWSRVLAA
jgi:transposase-like protein